MAWPATSKYDNAPTPVPSRGDAGGTNSSPNDAHGASFPIKNLANGSDDPPANQP
jgi:hypothetical protein